MSQPSYEVSNMIVLSGFLLMRSNLLRQWKERYIVLMDRLLSVAVDERSRPHESLICQSVSVEKLSNIVTFETISNNDTLVVKGTKGEVFYFRAINEFEFRHWKFSIESSVNRAIALPLASSDGTSTKQQEVNSDVWQVNTFCESFSGKTKLKIIEMLTLEAKNETL